MSQSLLHRKFFFFEFWKMYSALILSYTNASRYHLQSNEVNQRTVKAHEYFREVK